MNAEPDFEIYLVAPPGLETALSQEAAEKGFRDPTVGKGGVTVKGGWPEVWRANLELRGASRVLARMAAFRAVHLAKLDKKARQVPWADFLRPDVPVRVEAACKSSRIYHAGAAAQRISKAIAEELGAPVTKDAEVCLKARIHNDLCTISIDTSGEGLHKRGHKQAVNKAPMRETLAALFLKQCGFNGTEPVVDPMCGAGTFVIEAAEIAAGLKPGRSRQFAFEQLATFDASAWQEMREPKVEKVGDVQFYGFDRDAGAVRMAGENAARAGVDGSVHFSQQAISDLTAPEGAPGLVIVNPPYGGRIGSQKKLYPLYQALGKTLGERFQGWRVGLITNSDSLAKATGLPFTDTSDSISHGGLSVKLYRTKPLS